MMNRPNLQKAFANKFQSMGGIAPMPPSQSGSRPAGGQSTYKAPRPPQGGMMPPPPRPPQGMQMPKLFGNAMPGPRPPMGPPPKGGMMPPPPQGMPIRPPVMANKARGTMASHSRGPIGMP